MRCPSCAQNVEAGAAVCPHCEHAFDLASGEHLPDASNSPDEPTHTAPPPSKPPRPLSGARPSARGMSGSRPLPGKRPPPGDDSTQAQPSPPLAGRRPLPEDDPTHAAPSPAVAKPTRDDLATGLTPLPDDAEHLATGQMPAIPDEPEHLATGQIPALPDEPDGQATGQVAGLGEEADGVPTGQVAGLRREEDSTDQRPALELPDEPAPSPRARSGARAFAARAAPADAESEEDSDSTARDLAASEGRPRLKQPNLQAAPPKQKGPAPAPPARRGSGMTKALSLGKMDAIAPPPVDPETFFRNLGHTLLALPAAEKLEVGSATALAMMLFMPWQTTNSRANPDDDTIGLATWGGFWSLLFLAGAMGLFYLRQTGRLPALTPKLLSLGEALLSALIVPLTLVFILLSIKQHPVKSGLGVVTTRWASLPAFGSILGLLCGAGICVGAVLCFQRHRNDPA